MVTDGAGPDGSELSQLLGPDRADFEQLVEQYTGRPIEYHVRSKTTGLELAWIAFVEGRLLRRTPLNDEHALELARKHLERGLSWAPRITRCTDAEIKALIRAVEAAHGIGA